MRPITSGKIRGSRTSGLFGLALQRLLGGRLQPFGTWVARPAPQTGKRRCADAAMTLVGQHVHANCSWLQSLSTRGVGRSSALLVASGPFNCLCLWTSYKKLVKALERNRAKRMCTRGLAAAQHPVPERRGPRSAGLFGHQSRRLQSIVRESTRHGGVLLKLNQANQ